MRSFQVYRALDRIPNRFALCQTVCRGARHIHVDGTPFGGTVTAMLHGIESGEFHSPVEVRSPGNKKGLLAA
jgi:hypothetical protein